MNFVASRSFLADCDYKISNPESESKRLPDGIPVKDGESIYIHTTALDRFSKEMLPRINVKFVLYSGDSDMTIPGDCSDVATRILENPNLIRWYAQNCTKIDNPKLVQLPIGLDLHTLANRNHEWGPQQSSESQIQDIMKLKSQTVQKQNKCYANFQFLLWTRYAQDRKDAVAKISKDLVFYEPRKVPRKVTWNNMIQYKYVISPHGNGLDCHRTWEALILGCIPIVKTSPLDRMFEGLPVLIVKDWSDVTQELLNTFVPDRTRMDKLDRSAWKTSVWCPNDKHHVLTSQTGQITLNSSVGQLIVETIQTNNIRTLFEIGTWNGLGSTLCILEGLKQKSYDSFISLECNYDKHLLALKNLKSYLTDKTHLIHGTILTEEEIPYDIVSRTFPEIISNSEYRRWHSVDIENMKRCELVGVPDSIDFLLLDGGEFTTYFEFEKLFEKCKMFIALDDVNVSKCKIIRDKLKSNNSWKEVKYIPLRNGFSLFKHV